MVITNPAYASKPNRGPRHAFCHLPTLINSGISSVSTAAVEPPLRQVREKKAIITNTTFCFQILPFALGGGDQATIPATEMTKKYL